MLRPDCIWVWIFSTTSPSWIRSWVSLMPVISENALASVLASYSWVVMVSETTLISMARERLGRIDEPLHLLQLLVLGERRGLEFAVDPAAGFVHARRARRRCRAPWRARLPRRAVSSAGEIGRVSFVPPKLCPGRLVRWSCSLRFGQTGELLEAPSSDVAKHRRCVEQGKAEAHHRSGPTSPSQARWMKAAPSSEMKSRSPRVVGMRRTPTRSVSGR